MKCLRLDFYDYLFIYFYDFRKVIDLFFYVSYRLYDIRILSLKALSEMRVSLLTLTLKIINANNWKGVTENGESRVKPVYLVKLTLLIFLKIAVILRYPESP